MKIRSFKFVLAALGIIVLSTFLGAFLYGIEMDSLGQIILAMVLGDITIIVGVIIHILIINKTNKDIWKQQ